MNSPGTDPSPVAPRLRLSTLLLLGSLAVFSLWFLRMHLLRLHYADILQKGSAALAKKDTPGARVLFDTFIRSNPADPRAYIVINGACLESDNPTLALEYAQRGLETCKNAPNSERAELYLALAQSQALTAPAHPQTAAIASARTALSLDPKNLITQNALGFMLADNDQNLEEAENLLRQTLQSLPSEGNDPLATALRPDIEDSFGWLLYKKGDYPGAVGALNRAAQDMPTAEPGFIAKYFYYHLGAAYRKAGQTDEARRALDVALHYDPAFPEAKAEEALLPPQSTTAAPSPPSAPGLKL